MAAYASPADLVARYDADTIAQLATDNHTKISRADIPTDDNVLTALLTASGDIDVRLRVGRNYSPEQLTSLDDNSREHLRDIVCTIAMAKLFRRRPGVHRELSKEIREEADKYLDRLAKGENVLGIVDDDSHEEAGLPQLHGPSSQQICQRNFLSARMSGRYFPTIEERNPLSRG